MSDLRIINAAALALGWRVVRVSWEHARSGQALATVNSVIEGTVTK